MRKKFEYGQRYPDVVYRQLVKKWFNDNTNSLSDSELQKFVNLCMRGNLTFLCADEIDIDDPDISMIDHLLMDIASEKNDELINTYTDEIDWDNDYTEKYNKGSSMDKKLEARIVRLERLLSKNENLPKVDDRRVRKALDDIFNAAVVLSDARIVGKYIDDDSEYDLDSLVDDVSDIIQPIARICNGLGIEDEWTYRDPYA